MLELSFGANGHSKPTHLHCIGKSLGNVTRLFLETQCVSSTNYQSHLLDANHGKHISFLCQYSSAYVSYRHHTHSSTQIVTTELAHWLKRKHVRILIPISMISLMIIVFPLSIATEREDSERPYPSYGRLIDCTSSLCSRTPQSTMVSLHYKTL